MTADRRRIRIETRPNSSAGEAPASPTSPTDAPRQDVAYRPRRTTATRPASDRPTRGILLAVLGIVLVSGIAFALQLHGAPSTPASSASATATGSATSLASKAGSGAASNAADATSISGAGSGTPAAAKKRIATAAKKHTTHRTAAVRHTTASTSSSSHATAAAAPKTLPALMDHQLSGSRQVIVVTGTKIGSTSGTLALWRKSGSTWTTQLTTKAYFGANGLVDGTKRTEGHLQTPTGVWYLGSFVFGQHGSAPKGTKMPYRAITNDSWWSAAHDSTYNTWVNSSSHVPGEHLADAQVQYRYAFNSGYNAPPNKRVIGRGTAIFIHCSEPSGNSLGPNTHGCVAVPPSVMKQLFRLLDPKLKPTCAIGTLAKGTSTAIWSY